MFKLADKKAYKAVESFVSKDYARNYFIALGLKRGYDTYKSIYMFEGHMLFHRASGNLQFAYESGDISHVKDLINDLEFQTLIGAKSTCHQLGLKVVKQGAYIAALKKEDYLHIASDAEQLSVEDLYQVEDLYAMIFPGYPKVQYMKEKLESTRGVGYCIKDKAIVSVAQSDFHALIVGVATHPDHLRKGHALKCMHALIQSMFQTQDTVYLQYDNPDAGKLYDQLGFKIIDQVIHYKR